MAQADQVVQNDTFPTVRADINNNLAALFTNSSGGTAPTVTVAYQDWIDTSGTDPVWKKRNAANNAWITVATIKESTLELAPGSALPSQSGQSGKYLSTNGTIASWAAIALGATIQVFTSSGTFTPTAGKISFLVFCTGGGGGSGGATSISGNSGRSGGGGGGGTAIRLYDATEMGSTGAVTIGTGGAGGAVNGSGSAGGSSSFDPGGSGSTITGAGGSGSASGSTLTSDGAAGGDTTNSQIDSTGGAGVAGGPQHGGAGGTSFWAGGRGRGGKGVVSAVGGNAGTAGAVIILEW